MSDLDLLEQAVAALHEACFADDTWDRALMLMAKLLRSSSTVLAMESRALTFPVVHSLGLSPEGIEAYAMEFQSIDPLIAYVRGAPTGIAYTEAMAMEPRSFEASRFANDYAARFDMRHAIQAFTERGGEFAGFFAFARPARAGAYSDSDCALVQALLPQVRQVLRVRQRLRTVEFQRSAALDVLHRLDQGVFLVSRDLTITFTNREGERLLRSRSGLTTARGRLAAASPSQTARLHAVVRGAFARDCTADAGPLVLKRDGQRRPLLLRVLPFSPGILDGCMGDDLSIFLLAIDPDRPADGDRAGLGMMFGLTQVEVRVAWLLADGRSPAEIADSMAVSIATVRTHLSHLFQKTETRRQAEFVALVRRTQGIFHGEERHRPGEISRPGQAR